MGRLSRPRAMARRPKSGMQVEYAQVNEPFPKALLEFLFALPAADAADAAERPPKRVRVVNVEPIVVARESLTLSRPTQPDIPVANRDGPTSYANVGQYLKLNYDESAQTLDVCSHPQSQFGAFKSRLSLGQSAFTRQLLTVLQVVTRSRDDPADEGALWVATNIAVEQDGDGSTDSIHFTFELNWNPASYHLRTVAQRSLSQQVLDTFFASPSRDHGNTTEKLLPQAFYEAAFMPDESYPELPSDAVVGLKSKLYPFQRRAAQWLLMREGMKFSTDDRDKTSQLVPHSTPLTSVLPLSFRLFQDADGKAAYISDLYHIVTKDITQFQQLENGLKGGILAEEMGLGKTVEIISLILMHKRPPYPPTIVNPHTNQEVRPTGATLVVTPATLLKQWLSEFEKHAPDLHVIAYWGVKNSSTRKGQSPSLIELANCDVVVTTYNVLQADIHFAKSPPERSMRYEKQYERLQSPLTQLSWWRVCLDEAQQIESGVSNAAKVARLIPRVNAWGITGTPVKQHVQDLWGLLLFLHYDPFASSLAIWDGLVTTHKELFQPLFNRIALRHTKVAVRDELTLPSQNRFVVTMPFTAIEESYYQEQFKTLARSFGLDASGNPLQENWDPDDPYIVDLMKRALSKLRQSVLHPHLGDERGLGLRKDRPLRTIEEVLDIMIEQSESYIRAEQRAYLLSKLKKGQLLEGSPRIKEALAIWEEVRKEIQPVVAECREQLSVELEKAKQNKDAETVEGDDDNDDDDDSQDSEDSSENKNNTTRVGECRRKLRSALDVEHRAVFFIATAHYQIKSNKDMTQPGSEEFKRLEKLEADGYELAKQLRKEMLQDIHTKASSLMKKIATRAASQSFVEIAPIKSLNIHGLESQAILEKLELLRGYLDEQANLLDEWREQVIRLLLQPLVDQEGEAEITGDEYEDSTKIQDDLMAYTLALRAVLGDRQEYISGLKNERVRYETLNAIRQAKNGEGHAPEKTLALLDQREKVKSPVQNFSLRAIVVELRELATKLRHEADQRNDRARIELDIVQRHLVLIQKQITSQNKIATALERELDQYTSAMNSRVEFYKQLQGVSDTVAPLEIGLNSEQERDLIIRSSWKVYESEERSAQRKSTAVQAKHRYLLHLKDAGQNSNEPRTCVICQSGFTLGILTVCGHQFCKGCMLLWWRAHHNCPLCKKRLSLSMLHNITLKKQELRLHQEQSQSAGTAVLRSKSKKRGIYSEFNDAKLDAINNIVLDGPSFATKIDTLMKHIFWLRDVDPGAKSIIFSQFKGFLDVLARAFSAYRIGFTSFDNTGSAVAKFKQEPGIECFLMDARAHASGLNLVNASHVFLCEPLLNTALELQAIARVDRIGQKHETTVWLYLIDGTVEESIYNLSVRRRLEHISETSKGKSKETTPDVSDLNLEAANSMELQQASLPKLMDKEKELGETVDKNDLWECLFGHIAKGDNLLTAAEDDERMNNPAVMGFLAAEAADERRQAQAESEGAANGEA
ncbi:SNF2 family N-terminal domain-containing protein [Biscogniauxia mediterranea]|nr:SNF2 family N-terminal domain-containing protein [Biscogniauxia mediterranea]